MIADCVDHLRATAWVVGCSYFLFYVGRSVLTGHVWHSTSRLCVFPCLHDVLIGFARFPSVFPPSLVYLCLSLSLFVSLSVFVPASVMCPLSFTLCFTCICCLHMSLRNPICIPFCTLLAWYYALGMFSVQLPAFSSALCCILHFCTLAIIAVSTSWCNILHLLFSFALASY